MTTKKTLFIILLSLPIFSSCRSRFIIDSVPRGATVYLDGTAKGKTPLILEEYAYSLGYIPRLIKIEKTGYITKIGNLDTHYDTRHAWTIPLSAIPPIIFVETHPAMFKRFNEYYKIYLKEDVGEDSPYKLESFYGMDFKGTTEEQTKTKQRILGNIQ